MRQMGDERAAVQYPWMLDNGAFSSKWDVGLWESRCNELAGINNCIGTIAPDVVLDAKATRERWDEFAHIPRALGYKVFFATQNGCASEMIPWDELDGLFIGGNDEHRAKECFPLIAEAKERRVWVHVGRVNSYKNIMRFCAADSVDGTTFVFEATEQKTLNILRGINLCNQQQHGQLSYLD